MNQPRPHSELDDLRGEYYSCFVTRISNLCSSSFISFGAELDSRRELQMFRAGVLRGTDAVSSTEFSFLFPSRINRNSMFCRPRGISSPSLSRARTAITPLAVVQTASLKSKISFVSLTGAVVRRAWTPTKVAHSLLASCCGHQRKRSSSSCSASDGDFFTMAASNNYQTNPAALRNREPIWEVLCPILEAVVGDGPKKDDPSSEDGVEESLCVALEIAGGDATHAEYFTARAAEVPYLRSRLRWQTTEVDAEQVASNAERLGFVPGVPASDALGAGSSLCLPPLRFELPASSLRTATSSGSSSGSGFEKERGSGSAEVDVSQDHQEWRQLVALSCAAASRARAEQRRDSPSGTTGEARAIVGVIYASNLTHISPWSVTQSLLARAGAELRGRMGARLVVYGPFKRHGAFTTDSNAAFDANLRARDASWGYRDLESEVEPEAVRCGLRLLAVYEMPANNNLIVFGPGPASVGCVAE